MEDDREIFFYKRMLGHLARVYNNVVYLVDNHRDLLDKYGVNVAELLKNVVDHDRSKFKDPQFSAYVEITYYYYKQKGNGRNYPLDKVLSNNATIHHMITEKHHPEYWDKTFLLEREKFNVSNRDGLPEKPVDGTAMPTECIVEMVCDWKATADEKGNSVKEWADRMVNRRWKFLDEQVRLIYETIERLEENG